jgi:hypothetical protein
VIELIARPSSAQIIGALVFINKRRNADTKRGAETNLFRAYGELQPSHQKSTCLA